ncbi:MAG: VOC family protein [Pseudomonadota bacterium]
MEERGVSSLGYIGIQSCQLDAWRSFFEDFVGFASVETEQGLQRYRMDEQAWRLWLEEGSSEDLSFAGFSVQSRTTLADIQERLTTAGYEVLENTKLAEQRCVAALNVVSDPDGLQVELYCGPLSKPEQPFVSPLVKSGFLTGDQGLGHIVLYTADIDKKLEFYGLLGFRVSDTINMGGLDLVFMHCNPRHHTIALVPVSTGKHLNHLMVQVSSIDDVGYALDRVSEQQVQLSTTLGCHTNDRMISFYAKTPSGFDMEYGFGARVVSADWPEGYYEAPSIWGHKPVA